jgi:hypothetical protein
MTSIFVTTNSASAIAIYKNGSVLYNEAGAVNSSGGIGSMSSIVSLSATDYIDIRITASLTVQGGSLTAGAPSMISISQVH